MLDDTYDTLYPGGIFNDGFALGWAKDRQADAEPSTESGGGQGWASDRIKDGDETCLANQVLRLQAPDVMKQLRANAYRRGAASDALAPATFVHDIDVPVFLAGAWQDQETGSHFANMLGNFSPDIPMKVTVMNGLHQDSFGPAVLSQWIEFLDFYVAKEVPSIPAGTRGAGDGPALRRLRRRGDARARPLHRPDRATTPRCARTRPSPRCACCSTSAPTVADAVVLDHRAGVPAPRHHRDDLVPRVPTARSPTRRTDVELGADQFEYDPSAFPRTMETVDGEDGFSPTYGWKPVPDGKALAYVTDPLAADTVLAGTGSVDLWVRSSKPDVDLEVTISEVRPDGQETYVQSGWLRGEPARARHRRLDRPAPGADAHTRRRRALSRPRRRRAGARAALPVRARVPRAGSRIRIVVQPPGGNRPSWAFAALPATRTVTLSRSAAQPSKVVLPVVGRASTSRRRSPSAARCGANRAATTSPLENRTAEQMSSPVYDLADALRRALRRARSAGRDR